METPSPEDDPMFPQRWLEHFLRYTPEDSSTWTDREHIEFLTKERIIMSKVMSNLAKHVKIGVDDAIVSTSLVIGWNKFRQRKDQSVNTAKDEIRSYRNAINEARKEILIEHEKIFASAKNKNKRPTKDSE
jgi:hypothetical protein